MTRMKIRILQLAVLLMLPFSASTAQEGRDHNFDVAKNMQLFNEIYGYLDLMYVDTLNADETVGTAINSMLRSLDPYTVYYPENEVKDLRTMITGRYVGIGSIIRYNQKLERVVIDEPFAGSCSSIRRSSSSSGRVASNTARIRSASRSRSPARRPPRRD